MKLNKATMPTRETAIALVRRLKDRDQQALAEVYDAYGRIIFSLILGVVRDRGIAEDLTQETFLRVWKRAALFDENRGNLDAWITTVARNRAVDHLRVKSRRVECPAEAAEPFVNADAEEKILNLDRSRLLKPALERLSARQRYLLNLSYVQGLSHSEIAERLRQPLGTVKTLIRGAMKTMRAWMERAEAAA